MTNILTEQFLYGQLLDGYWYISIDGHEDILEVEKGKSYIGGALVARAFMGDKIDKIEVLAPVPSYNEYKRLQEQIDDLMGCLIAIRDRGCEKDFDCILSADITLQKWGVK